MSLLPLVMTHDQPTEDMCPSVPYDEEPPQNTRSDESELMRTRSGLSASRQDEGKDMKEDFRRNVPPLPSIQEDSLLIKRRLYFSRNSSVGQKGLLTHQIWI